MIRPSPTIACFVSSHGFGHAARVSSVLSALRRQIPDLQIEIYSQTPAWFFQPTLGDAFDYYPLLNDIGIVQATPFDENLSETINSLASFLPFNPEDLRNLGRQLKSHQVILSLCDISPLGISASRLAGIPAVLQENFTWDWIYEGYLPREPRFNPYINHLREVFALADCHIQTEPLCTPSTHCDLRTQPIYRLPVEARQKIRDLLDIPDDAPAILVTMGGIPPQIDILNDLEKLKNIVFIIPGGSTSYSWRNNLRMFPHHSTFYHPDLMNAVDAVIGKAGYSTIAEAFHAGIPFAFISRANFREAPVLSRFILDNMPGFEISEQEFPNRKWLERIPDLLSQPPLKHDVPNGADQIANYLLARYF